MESLKKDFFKKIIFLFFISWLFGISFLAHPQTSRASDFNKVILMVWDGTQRNHLNELLKAGKLPNLQSLINEGRKREMVIYTQNCQSSNDGDNYRTATGPGHAAMLTGYGYPTMRNHSNDNPNSIPPGYTIFERLKQFNPQIKTGMITGKGLKFFPFPAFENAAYTNCCYGGQCGKRNPNLSPIIDTCRPSNDANEDVGNRFLEFLDKNSSSPFFLFAHLKRPDTDGHANGENSQEYSNGIISDDQQLGRIVQKLKNLGVYDQTVLLVTTDHGFNEGTKTHGICDNYTKNLWAVSNKQWVINKEGVISKQTSIVPTIFDIFGINKNVNPPFAGDSLFAPPFSFKNVIVVGWDGVQRDHLLQCYKKELSECSNGLPNTKNLSGNKIFNNTTTNGATSTKPGWAQILSGYNAEVMGIYSNTDYQPLPEGYSIFEKLEKHFGQDNIVTLFVAGHKNNVGGRCQGEEGEEKGEPWCLTKKHLDYFQNGLHDNKIVGGKALELLEKYKNKRFFAFFHFSAPDYACHDSGENSAKYSKAIIDCDQWLGKIMAKLKDLGIYQETLIYVITDHGVDEDSTHHNNAPYGFLATNDPLVIRSGDRKDLAPTILKRYGVGLGRKGNIPTVNGFPLDSIPQIPCVSENEAYIDYPNSPTCCSGLKLISLDKAKAKCVPATGGTGDNSGYCTKCRDGQCQEPENKCNCLEDCAVINLSSGRNTIAWPDISNYTAKSALGDIDNNCGAGTAITISRKRKDWWEDYVKNYGGENFNLQNGQNYFINVSKSCNWAP